MLQMHQGTSEIHGVPDQLGQQCLATRITARALGIALLALVELNGCQKKPPPPPPPPVVQVMTVSPRDTPVYMEWTGTLEGYVNAQIRAEVTGYLFSQNYQEGSLVKKGDLLFQIDPRTFQASLDQAKANLAQAEAQQVNAEAIEKRYIPLAKTSAISQQELTSATQANLAAKAAVLAYKAAVETAELNLGYTKITSLVDGIAGVANAQIGDLVGPNGPILTVVSTIDPIKVYFNPSEQDYLSYRRQYTNEVERAQHERELELELILADGSVYPYRGKFLFVGREVNPRTGTVTVVGRFPNPDYLLRPGQFARIRAQVRIEKGALLVPQRAVNELQGSYQVATVDAQNKVHVQPVKLGDQSGSDWIITQGLKPGDRVVAEGTQKVKPGMTVMTQPFAAPKQSGGPGNTNQAANAP